MALSNPALLANVAKRLIRVLNANPGAWDSSVGIDSNAVGAFPDNDEITAALLEADEHVVTRGYFQSVNRALAEPFMTKSANIPSGGKIPFHYGLHGKVELSAASDFAALIEDVELHDADDVKAAIIHGAYVSPAAFVNQFAIDADHCFYHVAPFGRVEIPVYTRSAILQANKSEETLILATAIRFLNKHASPAKFGEWKAESVDGIAQLVNDGAYQANQKLQAEGR